MPESVVLTGEEFVRRSGREVCLMPEPGVTVAVVYWSRNAPWLDSFRRMVDHLRAGTTVVLLLAERHRWIGVYRDDAPPRQFGEAETLTLPDVLPGFSVPVAALFA